MLSDRTDPNRQPMVWEVVGPAGVGKTTLVRALKQSRPEIVTDLNVSRAECAAAIWADVLRLLPTLFHHVRHTRWFTRGELRSMAYLSAWPRRIRKQARLEHPVVLFDHGPIFRLVFLMQFGPELRLSRAYQAWWHNALRTWTNVLDTVIWLDAPDPVLVERIHARNSMHCIKGKGQGEAYEFLRLYRAGYGQIVSRLADGGGPRILQFDTSREPPHRIRDAIWHRCRENHSETLIGDCSYEGKTPCQGEPI